MVQLIDKFFAVTKTSVFRILRQQEKLSVIKTHMRAGEVSKLQVDDKLQIMKYLAVTVKMGIFSYDVYDRPESIPVAIRNAYLPGTSEVKALFMDEDSALLCLNSMVTDVHDPNWAPKTKEVIRAIGDDPVIKVSNHPLTGFPEEFFV